MKSAYILCFCVVCALTIGVFRVKFYVRGMQRSLAQTQKEIEKVNCEISALKAEWTALNSPERLTALASKYLQRDNRVLLSEQIKKDIPSYEAQKKELQIKY
ncbi:cell division protein FtsL [Anaplasma capra]|uniref:cell division protein FtsL n=1 Tax=Anaplasma capra TaxID=1562740 RepID=UPI0021D6112D|nr:cell division protein FtsL [Anaplasma capra]MCU7611651.1 cell division protein FtsL [Anaplasma capra]MCU7612200.1 cell division protein FtsL [Anaplasma capra]